MPFFNYFSSFELNKDLVSYNTLGYHQILDQIGLNDFSYYLRNDLFLDKNLDFGDAEWVMHLRFGDAPNMANNIQYYNKVLEFIGDDSILFCTDSFSTAEKWLKGNGRSNFRILSLDTLLSFKYLLNAKNLAIAPSTFSWWAAALGDNKRKIVSPIQLHSLNVYLINQKRLVEI